MDDVEKFDRTQPPENESMTKFTNLFLVALVETSMLQSSSAFVFESIVFEL